MYDAPNVQLSGTTKVDVYSARVVAPIKKTPFALYEIEVIDGDNEWLLSKRYSEFFRLYTDVCIYRLYFIVIFVYFYFPFFFLFCFVLFALLTCQTCVHLTQKVV